MTIPDPVALAGDAVEVFNFRRKARPWETARVERAHYTPAYGGIKGTWFYRVILDRKSGAGRTMRMPIRSDASIRRAMAVPS